MSTPEKVALMSQARARGYEVPFVFVTTEDPEINVQRVANRVALGGHGVPADAIRSRYEAAMQLLPVSIKQATSVLIYDNSVPGCDAVLVAQKTASSELEIMNSQTHRCGHWSVCSVTILYGGIRWPAWARLFKKRVLILIYNN